MAKKKIHDDEVNKALDLGRIVKRGNSAMWDPTVCQPSDKEVLASLGLKEDGSPTT